MDARSQRIVQPLDTATRVLAAAVAVLGALGHREWLADLGPADLMVGPQALLLLSLTLTSYFVIRSRLGDPADRHAAAAGPLVAYYALLRTLTEPTLELIAAPSGVYLIAVAAWSERALRIRIAPGDRRMLESLGSLLVLAPLVFARLDVVTTARALVETLVFLVAGAALARPRVAVIGALSVGVLGVRLIVGGLGTFGPWAVFGVVGLVLLGLGALLVRRAA